VLKFDASLGNVGSKAMHIGAVANSPLSAHNVYEYSPCHQHSHFRFYGDFAFATGAGLSGDKRSFCLLSTTRYANHEGSPLHVDYDNCFFQGIGAGWGDDYFAGLDCQWVDVTDVPAGDGPTVAPLTFLANPAGFLCEGTPVLDAQGVQVFEPTSYVTSAGAPIDRPVCDFVPGYQDNDFGSVSVSLPPRGSAVTVPCTHGQMGPARDCGFAEQASSSCVRGTATTLVCQAPSGSAPQLVRLCEHSQRLGGGVPCTAPTALGYGVWSGTPLSLSVGCPTQRDDAELGGKLTVYAAPVFAGDPAATVDCVVQ
jgi:hypothetical protein